MKRATIYDYARMCKKIGACMNCLLGVANNGADMVCRDFVATCPNKANEIILKWCKEHPIKTRQSEFLKIFPNAKIDVDGALSICPQCVNKDFSCQTEKRCSDCCKDYWLAEV